MTKTAAKQKLRDEIEKSLRQPSRPTNEATLRWFWEKRYVPMYQGKWRSSTQSGLLSLIDQHLLRKFGETVLADLNKPDADWRFQFQMHLNELAEDGYSKSTVSKTRIWLRAILDEAVEQEFISRNPARKLSQPETRAEAARALMVPEIVRLINQLSGRDRLITRLFIECGFRPGELFALRRNDFIAGQLRVDEKVWEGELFDEVKTESSAGFVWVPNSLRPELEWWIASHVPEDSRSFLFPSETGKTPLAPRNFLQRILRPAGERANLGVVDCRTLRRTCSTQLGPHASVKSAQTHMRHANPTMTIGVYQKQIPEEVKSAVDAMGKALALAIDASIPHERPH